MDSIDINFDKIEEPDKLKQIEQFIQTAKVLFEQDDIKQLSDHLISKFFIGKEGHNGKALEALSETLAWRKAFKIDHLKEESFPVQEQTEKLVFFGKALDKSNLLIFTASKQEDIRTVEDIDKNLRFIVNLLEKATNSDNGLDKLTLIVDMTKAKYAKQEIKLVSQLTPILQKNYPETLARLILFPTNSIFWITFSAAKYFVDPKTLPKLLLTTESVLKQYIDTDAYYSRLGEDGVAPLEKSLPPLKKTKIPEVKVIEAELIFKSPEEYDDV